MLIPLVFAMVVGTAQIVDRRLTYHPAPVENPLKGLVPYAGEHRGQFPHSLEFSYLPLSALLKRRGEYDWSRLEKLLNEVAGRGHQTIFRVYVEYPGEPSGLPDFLRQEGVRVNEYSNGDSSSKTPNYTPDYRDPTLASALTQFIGALGKRYDGDPRIGYITAGLLGHWGEWHTYPREDLAPPLALQASVMDAYERSFRRTPILLRYPADKDASYASNRARPFGYHDDSFAWATLDTGRNEDGWFFVPKLKEAKALDKWKRHPIGGEIRPEAWGKVFDAKPDNPQIQNFRTCVDQTHVTWLMDSGMFGDPQPTERMQRAKREVARMGYEFTITRVRATSSRLFVSIENRGVAPFYHDWPIELAWFTKGKLSKPWRPGWKLTGILPKAPAVWTGPRPTGKGSLLLRVRNPLPNGIPLRFANESQDQHVKGWLTLINETVH